MLRQVSPRSCGPCRARPPVRHETAPRPPPGARAEALRCCYGRAPKTPFVRVRHSQAMADVSSPELVEREYATLDRLANRRLDRTGWLRGVEEISVLLGAIAEAHPHRVL